MNKYLLTYINEYTRVINSNFSITYSNIGTFQPVRRHKVALYKNNSEHKTVPTTLSASSNFFPCYHGIKLRPFIGELHYDKRASNVCDVSYNKHE